MRDVIENFLTVPAVIAAGDDFHARGKKIVGQSRCDAETGSGIFAIRDYEIYLMLRDDFGEMLREHLAAGRADNISDKKNAHERTFLFSVRTSLPNEQPNDCLEKKMERST
jgi:hypothetical protein